MNFLSHESKKGGLRKSWVKRAFPVPNLLVLSNTSVTVSDGVLRFFECTRKRNILCPKDFGVVTFPRLNVESVTEKIKADAALILKTWAKKQKVSIVNAIVHEDEVYVFKATIPTINPKEIHSAVEALLEENVPIPPSDALFEYDVILSDEKLKETTLAVSVLSKTSTSEFLSLFKDTGIQVASLDTESHSITKALFPRHDPYVHAVLSIAKRHSIVFIVDRGTVVFSSSIEVGEVDLNRAVAKTLNITEEAAEALKKNKNPTDNDGDVKLFEAMIPVFGTIRDELGKMLIYWKTQSKKERQFIDISDVILLGSASLTPGFAQYVSATAKIPARIGSVWTNTLTPDVSLPRLHHSESLDYGALIGSLL